MTLSLQTRIGIHGAKERRLSHVGIPKLHRTHRIFGGTVMAIDNLDPDILFPGRNVSMTFKTVIRIADNATARSGLIFEFGGATRGSGVWIGNQTLGYVCGGLTAELAEIVYDEGTQWGATRLLNIVACHKFSSGEIWLFLNGKFIGYDQASGGDFGATWTDINNGSFAMAQSGFSHGSIVETGIPTNFAVVEPLSVYVNQLPRHAITPGPIS